MRPRLEHMVRTASCLLVLALAYSSARPEPREVAAADAPVLEVGLVARTGAGAFPLPILAIDVDLKVTGIMLRGVVTAEFSNPTSEVLSATYVLPLPERASVDSMELRVGDRRIVSVVEEKEEAQATYVRAEREGRKASLVSEKRPNLFMTSVANINPGERVSVRIELLSEVGFAAGTFHAAFPLTLAPRYAPASPSAPAEDKTAQGTPHETGGTAPRVTLRVGIDAGFPLEAIRSSSHRIRVQNDGRTATVVPEGNPIPADRDFLLEWEPRGSPTSRAGVVVEDRPEGRYALVMMVPPAPQEDGVDGLPTETLFVVDTSGSMDGPSIEQARTALLAALDRLRPGDTFDVLEFNSGTRAFRDRLEPADAPALEDARAWVRSLQASGGTEILPALLTAMNMMSDGGIGSVRRIILITDGAVSNEEETFREVSGRLGEIRLHVIGIGVAPNRYLMKKLAQFGRGSCAFIASATEVETRMSRFLEQLDRPVLTDLRLDWEGAPPIDAFPSRMGDLYAGEPSFVSLRLGLAHPGTKAVLSGKSRGGPVRFELDVPEGAPKGSGVASRWARAKVGSLLDGLHEGADPEEIRRQVVEVAKEFHLVTRYTSLVAVEETPTAEGATTTVAVANQVPFAGTLPQGGTFGPMLLRAGIALTLAGVLLAWVASRTRA